MWCYISTVLTCFKLEGIKERLILMYFSLTNLLKEIFHSKSYTKVTIITLWVSGLILISIIVFFTLFQTSLKTCFISNSSSITFWSPVSATSSYTGSSWSNLHAIKRLSYSMLLKIVMTVTHSWSSEFLEASQGDHFGWPFPARRRV